MENTKNSYQIFREELFKAGLLIPSGVDGLYGRGGLFERVITHFETYVTKAGSVLNADEMSFPPILNREHYLTTDHIHNFPDLMGSVHSFCGNEAHQSEMLRKLENGENWTAELSPTKVMMIPAACYPLYPAMAGTLPASGRTIDLRSFVFRHEPSEDPARLQIFRQHEWVRLGTAEQAIEHRDFWIKTSMEVLGALELPMQLVVANDPFFGRGGRLRKATQREQELKHEMVVPICSTEKPTAIASVNYHLDSFGMKFKINTPDGKPAHSSCVGFGLERIALALFKTHGFDTKKWPAQTRELLQLN